MRTFQEILKEANDAVPSISPEEAKSLQDEGALIIDIRELEEIKATGKAQGAFHIPRGLLEFQTKLTNPNGLEGFTPENNIILYCASGGRAALAGKSLKDMGFEKVFNLGGLKDWAEANLPIEK
ncbi:MAG: rhodanese [Rhodobiaceae bacterium]|nr:rhodanese [Rhodobiaceae bacterium]|tara:strand:- start:2 stop:373 length:372 start_codon:yes stop_codon:yes gene_type:complete